MPAARDSRHAVGEGSRGIYVIELTTHITALRLGAPRCALEAGGVGTERRSVSASFSDGAVERGPEVLREPPGQGRGKVNSHAALDSAAPKARGPQLAPGGTAPPLAPRDTRRAPEAHANGSRRPRRAAQGSLGATRGHNPRPVEGAARPLSSGEWPGPPRRPAPASTRPTCQRREDACQRLAASGLEREGLRGVDSKGGAAERSAAATARLVVSTLYHAGVR